MRQCALLIRVLRRVLEIAFEKVLRRAFRRYLPVDFHGRKGSGKGSKKGCKKGFPRRHLAEIRLLESTTHWRAP